MEEEEEINEGINESKDKDIKKKTDKKVKGNNNYDNIENQLKIEYKNEEIKKSKAYNQLLELKKEENLINLNIQYFENLLMKMKYNE